MRPGVSVKSHRLIKAQSFMGDLAGERIDFQNSQRGARQDLRQQLFTIATGAQRIVDRQMFDITVAGKQPAAAEADKYVLIEPRLQRVVRVAQRLKFGLAFALLVSRKGARVERIQHGEMGRAGRKYAFAGQHHTLPVGKNKTALTRRAVIGGARAYSAAAAFCASLSSSF